MKKQILPLLSVLLLIGCSSERKPDSFCCFYGNMEISQMKVSYSTISDKPILWQANDSDTNYYANLYCLTSEVEYDQFFKTTFTLSEFQKEPTGFPVNSMEVVCFAQIPSGYKAYKRDNIQKTDDDNHIMMITDNFYYYENRPDLSYLKIDIRKDPSKTEASVFCLKYVLSDRYSETLKKENIRVMFSSK